MSFVPCCFTIAGCSEGLCGLAPQMAVLGGLSKYLRILLTEHFRLLRGTLSLAIMTSEQREVDPRCDAGALTSSQSRLMANHPDTLEGQPWRSLAHFSSAWMSIQRRLLWQMSSTITALRWPTWAPLGRVRVTSLNSSASCTRRPNIRCLSMTRAPVAPGSLAISATKATTAGSWRRP
jgi:hypothetical protein